ncbi:MAG: lytic transglycosylase domain-containing protein, partial [Clostridia bacterium]
SHLVREIQATFKQETAQEKALQQQRATLATLEAQAQATANQAATALAQQQNLESQLKAQALSEQSSITSLNSQLAQISQEIQALLAQFASGFLSRQQLFDALYPLVAPIANQYGLSPYLVLGVITEESGGNSKIVSYTGAIGLMQVEPSTAADYGFTTSELYDPAENVTAGCDILAALLGPSGFPASRWGAYSESMALVGYNAGPGTVDESIQQYQSDPTAYPTPLSWAYQNIGGVQGYATNIEALQALYQSWGAP